ncbi:MAG: CheR family methyltransferase [Chryseolinea sp.]
MNQALLDFDQSPRISKEGFDQISKYVNTTYGINLSEAKKNLVENRLFNRLRLLRMNTYAEYIRHIFEPNGKQELELLCDFLSTNKTYFYREPAHFHFVQDLLKNAPSGKSWKVWSAASSAGDEAYTLSCIFEDILKAKSLQYSILGTDISKRMIDEAREGMYAHNRINLLPSNLTKAYFTKTQDERKQEYYCASQVIRKNVRFQQFNLISDIRVLNEKFDIIFCRNVLIYFKDEMKQQVVNELISKLNPGGYLILGHCEGMICRNTGLKQIGSAIFLNHK